MWKSSTVVQGHIARMDGVCGQNLNGVFYLTSSCSSNFVHIRLDCVTTCGHGGPISQKNWLQVHNMRPPPHPHEEAAACCAPAHACCIYMTLNYIL